MKKYHGASNTFSKAYKQHPSIQHKHGYHPNYNIIESRGLVTFILGFARAKGEFKQLIYTNHITLERGKWVPIVVKKKFNPS